MAVSILSAQAQTAPCGSGSTLLSCVLEYSVYNACAAQLVDSRLSAMVFGCSIGIVWLRIIASRDAQISGHCFYVPLLSLYGFLPDKPTRIPLVAADIAFLPKRP